jgi:hypothetical protein
MSASPSPHCGALCLGARLIGPVSLSPDELVDHQGDLAAWDRTDSQLPSAAIGMLCQARTDAGLLEQAADDCGPTVSFPSRPPHVDAEAAVV